MEWERNELLLIEERSKLRNVIEQIKAGSQTRPFRSTKDRSQQLIELSVHSTNHASNAKCMYIESKQLLTK